MVNHEICISLIFSSLPSSLGFFKKTLVSYNQVDGCSCTGEAKSYVGLNSYHCRLLYSLVLILGCFFSISFQGLVEIFSHDLRFIERDYSAQGSKTIALISYPSFSCTMVYISQIFLVHCIPCIICAHGPYIIVLDHNLDTVMYSSYAVYLSCQTLCKIHIDWQFEKVNITFY